MRRNILIFTKKKKIELNKIKMRVKNAFHADDFLTKR